MLWATRRPFLNFSNEVCFIPTHPIIPPAGRRFEVVVQFHQILMFHHELCEYLASASLKLLERGLRRKMSRLDGFNVHVVLKNSWWPSKNAVFSQVEWCWMQEFRLEFWVTIIHNSLEIIDLGDSWPELPFPSINTIPSSFRRDVRALMSIFYVGKLTRKHSW